MTQLLKRFILSDNAQRYTQCVFWMGFAMLSFVRVTVWQAPWQELPVAIFIAVLQLIQVGLGGARLNRIRALLNFKPFKRASYK